MRSYAFFFWLITAIAATPISPVPLNLLVRTMQAEECKKIHFFYARGTGEQGTMGRSVGPLMTNGLKQEFGENNVFSEGVEYPADWNGAISGAINPKGAKGAVALTSMVKKTLQDCPKSNIVLCGYSQGAEQVHGALMNLGSTGAKVRV